MPKIKSNRIAVYVYRKTPGGPEFLQLLRAPGQGDYGGIWSIVYGGIKSGETAVEAALRELREETGLKPAAFHQVEFLEMFYHRGRDRVNVLPVFAAAAPRNHKVVLNDEHTDFRWTYFGREGCPPSRSGTTKPRSAIRWNGGSYCCVWPRWKAGPGSTSIRRSCA